MTTTTTTTRPAPPSYRKPAPTTEPSPTRLTPLPDPPRCPDMAIQYPHLTHAHIILEDWVVDWPNALVMGAGYLCYDAGDIRHAPYPDCIVSLNLDIPPEDVIASNGYIISEVGKPPDFVLEVASRSTGRRDYTIKRDIYARYNVREYWRFDHTGGRYHDAPLAGDEWVDGRWRPIRIRRLRDGSYRGYSRVLGLELCWEDGELRFLDPATGEYLPDLTEAKTRMFEAEAQTVAEQVARQMAETQMVEAQAQAVAERTARQMAEAQMVEAQAQTAAEQAARQTAEAQRDSVAAELREAIERIRQLEARQYDDEP